MSQDLHSKDSVLLNASQDNEISEKLLFFSILTFQILNTSGRREEGWERGKKGRKEEQGRAGEERIQKYHIFSPDPSTE